MESQTKSAASAGDVNGWLNDAIAYGMDFCQRSVLFMDILRQRGNTYFAHIRNGMPPALKFDYETVLDGRTVDPAVNFQLVRIRDRRRAVRAHSSAGAGERRPILILDPRAGGGPGIGGSKPDSEIGMALDQGHPVYFVLFSPTPAPGQTLPDVIAVLGRFVDAVAGAHPGADKPALIGNCQGGWAVAMLGALFPERVGPVLLNGAPLSFWSGVAGKNPMRYRGGLTGGAWLVSLWGDLGNGRFDGAHLTAGFEDLNLSRTLWDKPYYLWQRIDTEAERYLDFEKWWNGFFLLTGEEMHFIVDRLFVGNRMEQGDLSMLGRRLDLSDIRGPVFVFASRGDNITPPQQALDWIPAVWGTVDAIRRQRRVIVYMVHDTIGHLGIFVSAAVSRREHRQMIASLEAADFLAPGLYEMVISEADDGTGPSVRFESRRMADIAALDDGADDADAFRAVAAVSRVADISYRLCVRPWVRFTVGETAAAFIRQLHPLRMSRYVFADMNPQMLPFRLAAPLVKNARRPVSPDNRFMAWERRAAGLVKETLDFIRDVRDLSQEFWFRSVWGNPLLGFGFGGAAAPADTDPDACDPRRADEAAVGGFAEGVVRMTAALVHAGTGADRQAVSAYERLAGADRRLTGLTGDRLKEMVSRQACILSVAPDAAFDALTVLIPEAADRSDALGIVREVLPREILDTPETAARLDALAGVLGIGRR